MDVDEEVTILCAVRYAIGRMSYAPSCVVNHILANKDRVSKKTIENIKRDIAEQESPFAYEDEWRNLVSELEKSNEETKED